MATAHLLYGYLGAGKTTFAKKLQEKIRAVRFSPDEWMVALYGSNPPPDKFNEYHRRIQGVIDEMWLNVLRAGVDVILDFGFWGRLQRDEVRQSIAAAGGVARLYEVRATEMEMLARCLARNANLQGSLIIEENTFRLLKPQFEALGPDEEVAFVYS